MTSLTQGLFLVLVQLAIRSARAHSQVQRASAALHRPRIVLEIDVRRLQGSRGYSTVDRFDRYRYTSVRLNSLTPRWGYPTPSQEGYRENYVPTP